MGVVGVGVVADLFDGRDVVVGGVGVGFEDFGNVALGEVNVPARACKGCCEVCFRVDAARAESSTLVSVGTGDDGHTDEVTVLELQASPALDEVTIDDWVPAAAAGRVEEGVDLLVWRIAEALKGVESVAAAGSVHQSIVTGLVVDD